MKKNMTPMTQQWISERFGVPTSGPAFGSMTQLRSAVSGTAALVATARTRQICATAVVAKGHLGSVATCDIAYVPGNNAWSPPLC